MIAMEATETMERDDQAQWQIARQAIRKARKNMAKNELHQEPPLPLEDSDSTDMEDFDSTISAAVCSGMETTQRVVGAQIRAARSLQKATQNMDHHSGLEITQERENQDPSRSSQNPGIK